MGATIATLLDRGWEPKGPSEWLDRFGEEWVFEEGPGGKQLLEEVFGKEVLGEQWERAALHRQGGGLKGGGDLTIPKRFRRKIQDPKGKGLFDMVATGAGWTPARKHQAGYNHDGKCPYCGAPDADTLHMVWQCPVVCTKLGMDREETQHLESLPFKEGMTEQEKEEGWARGNPPPEMVAFWTRGIPPKLDHLEAPFTRLNPPAHKGIQWLGKKPDELTPAELASIADIGTDGSGGKASSDPRIRRGGWAWIALDKEGQFVTGAHAQLEGDEEEWKQTVHRAELRALGHLLEAFGEGERALAEQYAST